jgi:discs large protein 5
MYEHALKLESEYRQYISGKHSHRHEAIAMLTRLNLISVVIQGVNITHMSTQIKTAVDVEQKKILWVPRNS